MGGGAESALLKADLQLTVPIHGVLDIPLTAMSGAATLGTVNCTHDAMTSTPLAATTTIATADVTLGSSNIAPATISGYGGAAPASGDDIGRRTDATMATDPGVVSSVR